jgi:hypothetical protein
VAVSAGEVGWVRVALVSVGTEIWGEVVATGAVMMSTGLEELEEGEEAVAVLGVGAAVVVLGTVPEPMAYPFS